MKNYVYKHWNGTGTIKKVYIDIFLLSLLKLQRLQMPKEVIKTIFLILLQLLNWRSNEPHGGGESVEDWKTKWFIPLYYRVWIIKSHQLSLYTAICFNTLSSAITAEPFIIIPYKEFLVLVVKLYVCI